MITVLICSACFQIQKIILGMSKFPRYLNRCLKIIQHFIELAGSIMNIYSEVMLEY